MATRTPLLLSLALAVGCAPSATKPTAEPQLLKQELAVRQDLSSFTLILEGEAGGPVPLTLISAHAEVVLDGQVVKALDLPLSGSAPAGGSTAFTLEASHQLAADAEQLKALGERSNPYLAALRGTVKAKANGRTVELPFARSKEFRAPKLPQVLMHELEGARYSPQEAQVRFYLGVKNPNSFPLHLKALNYAAKVNGKALLEGKAGQGEKVAAASTGVFEVTLSVDAQTYGADVGKLIASGTLPYEVSGALVGGLFELPYQLTGTLKLNASR